MFRDRTLMRVELARLQGTNAILVEEVKALSSRVSRAEKLLYAFPVTTIGAAVALYLQHH